MSNGGGIKGYMALLAGNPQARQKHKGDPDKAMQDFGLTAEQIAIIKQAVDMITEAVREEDPNAVQALRIVFG
jgi:hypothetical protein